MTQGPTTGTVLVFPTSCESGCSVASKPLYLGPNGKLTFSGPAKEEKAERYTEFVSDPAKPVPYRPRPILDKDGSGWRTWLLTDQRFVDGRPDVLTFVTDPLSAPMKLSGEPVVHLIASTSGTDSDWVVKLIDVYPNRELGTMDLSGVFAGLIGEPWDMNGYELPVAVDIFRGRYRTSFEHPSAIESGRPLSTHSDCRWWSVPSRLATESWFRCSQRSSRSMTGIRNDLCLTSLTPKSRTIRKLLSVSGTRAAKRAISVCLSCLLVLRSEHAIHIHVKGTRSPRTMWGGGYVLGKLAVRKWLTLRNRYVPSIGSTSIHGF